MLSLYLEVPSPWRQDSTWTIDSYCLGSGHYFLTCKDFVRNKQNRNAIFKPGLMHLNLIGRGENLVVLLIEETDVPLLLCILMFDDGRSVVEGKITAGHVGQIHTV